MEVTSKKFNYDNKEYNFYGVENEHIYKQIPWYEHELLIHIKKLNLNGVYVDVGGNIGNHSLFFLNHCNSTKLYVFEPDSVCFDILNKNLMNNSNKEYVLQKIAIWNRKTQLKLKKYESTNNMGMSKTYESYDNNVIDEIIDADSLDNIISYNENIVLIKIDAEGGELKILEGAINIIKLNNPVIVCEAGTENEFESINKLLLPLGYSKPNMVFNATPTYIWKY